MSAKTKTPVKTEDEFLLYSLTTYMTKEEEALDKFESNFHIPGREPFYDSDNDDEVRDDAESIKAPLVLNIPVDSDG